MPMYEYRCTNCKYEFELRQKFSDQPANQCPQCGSAVEKLISSAGFALKGDGWYNTGYCPKTEEPKPAACSGCACSAA